MPAIQVEYKDLPATFPMKDKTTGRDAELQPSKRSRMPSVAFAIPSGTPVAWYVKINDFSINNFSLLNFNY